MLENLSKVNGAAYSLKRAPKASDFQVKYKTEMCRKWELGCCGYADKCAFAHGRDELQVKPRIPSNYKTKECRLFFEEGVCLYGIRCQFSHKKTLKSTAPCTPKSSRNSSIDKTPARLPVFVKLVVW